MTARDKRLSWAWGALPTLVLANTAALIFLFLPARVAQSQLEGRIRELERNVRNLQRDGRTSDALLTAMREAEEFLQGFPRRTDLVGLMGRLTSSPTRWP